MTFSFLILYHLIGLTFTFLPIPFFLDFEQNAIINNSTSISVLFDNLVRNENMMDSCYKEVVKHIIKEYFTKADQNNEPYNDAVLVDLINNKLKDMTFREALDIVLGFTSTSDDFYNNENEFFMSASIDRSGNVRFTGPRYNCNLGFFGSRNNDVTLFDPGLRTNAASGIVNTTATSGAQSTRVTTNSGGILDYEYDVVNKNFLYAIPFNTDITATNPFSLDEIKHYNLWKDKNRLEYFNLSLQNIHPEDCTCNGCIVDFINSYVVNNDAISLNNNIFGVYRDAFMEESTFVNLNNNNFNWRNIYASEIRTRENLVITANGCLSDEEMYIIYVMYFGDAFARFMANLIVKILII